MTSSLSNGKQNRLDRVSNSDGVIAALAIDQRSALRNLLAKAKAISEEAVESRMLEEFKEAVSRILSPHASAILLDPEYGLSAARQRAKNSVFCWHTNEPAMTRLFPGDCRICWMIGRYGVWRMRERIAQKYCCTTRLSARKRLTM
jgi:tagatose 1,6-diphosphate aldolase